MNKYREEVQKLSNLTIEGTSLEEGCCSLLTLKDDSNILEHLEVQCGAYAYFACLLNDAKAELETLNTKHKLWKSQARQILMQDEAFASRAKLKKFTLADIDAEMDVRYEVDEAKWKTQTVEATDLVETLRVLTEAWKMKKSMLSDIANFVSFSGGANTTVAFHQQNNQPKFSKKEAAVVQGLSGLGASMRPK